MIETFDEEKLVSLIVKKLIKRQKSTLFLSLSKPFSSQERGETDFLQHYTIYLSNVTSTFLQNLVTQDTTDPWVKWLLQAYQYDCQIILHIPFDAAFLIPKKLLLKWPIKLVSNDNRQYIMLKENILTYEKIMNIPPNSILLLYEKQRFTSLAKEALEKQKISLLERN